MLHLPRATHEALKAAALGNTPNEAVGLIDAEGNIWELNNTHHDPTSAFQVNRDDIRFIVEDSGFTGLSEATLWHTHPSGGVGPSRIDLQNKTPFKYHLVVSVVDGDIVLTWY